MSFLSFDLILSSAWSSQITAVLCGPAVLLKQFPLPQSPWFISCLQKCSQMPCWKDLSQYLADTLTTQNKSYTLGWRDGSADRCACMSADDLR